MVHTAPTLPSKAVQLPQASILGSTCLVLFRDDADSTASRSGLEPPLWILPDGLEDAASAKRSKWLGLLVSVVSPVCPHFIEAGLAKALVVRVIRGGRAVHGVYALEFLVTYSHWRRSKV